jgi:phosphoadenosine phosphosulfate reductase
MTIATNIDAVVDEKKALLAAQLEQTNQALAGLTAEQRVAWTLEHVPQQVVLSSSFGIQAAVMLHLVTQQAPNIPVILTDTGYLFPETYRFIDELTERLTLNLKIYRSELTPAWQEARYGQLWLKGAEGIKQYNQMNKVEPMKSALEELDAGAWFSGIRAGQSSSRANKALAEYSYFRGKDKPVLKVHPILEWNNKDIYDYLQKHNLPYHPLWEEGYVSMGDTHTTRRLEPGMSEEDTRFFGLNRECGLHELTGGDGI